MNTSTFNIHHATLSTRIKAENLIFKDIDMNHIQLLNPQNTRPIPQELIQCFRATFLPLRLFLRLRLNFFENETEMLLQFSQLNAIRVIVQFEHRFKVVNLLVSHNFPQEIIVFYDFLSKHKDLTNIIINSYDLAVLSVMFSHATKSALFMVNFPTKLIQQNENTAFKATLNYHNLINFIKITSKKQYKNSSKINSYVKQILPLSSQNSRLIQLDNLTKMRKIFINFGATFTLQTFYILNFKYPEYKTTHVMNSQYVRNRFNTTQSNLANASLTELLAQQPDNSTPLFIICKETKMQMHLLHPYFTFNLPISELNFKSYKALKHKNFINVKDLNKTNRIQPKSFLTQKSRMVKSLKVQKLRIFPKNRIDSIFFNKILATGNFRTKIIGFSFQTLSTQRKSFQLNISNLNHVQIYFQLTQKSNSKNYAEIDPLSILTQKSRMDEPLKIQKLRIFSKNRIESILLNKIHPTRKFQTELIVHSFQKLIEISIQALAKQRKFLQLNVSDPNLAQILVQ